MDGIIESGWVEGNADSDEGVHLVVLFGDRIVLRVLLKVLGARNVDEDVAEHADGICVSAHHHVGESHVVVGCKVCCHNTGEHGLLVELNVIKGLQSEAEITEKAVDSQKTDDREISEHAVQGLRTIVSCDSHGLLVALHRSQLFVDLGSLNEGVENVEDGVAAPGVWCFAED